MEKKTLQSYLEEKLSGEGTTKERYDQPTLKENFEIKSAACDIRLSDVAKYVVDFYTSQRYNQLDPREIAEGQVLVNYYFKRAEGGLVSVLVTVHSQGGMILGTVQSLDDFEALVQPFMISKR